jgi:hypothetical protein
MVPLDEKVWIGGPRVIGGYPSERNLRSASAHARRVGGPARLVFGYISEATEGLPSPSDGCTGVGRPGRLIEQRRGPRNGSGHTVTSCGVEARRTQTAGPEVWDAVAVRSSMASRWHSRGTPVALGTGLRLCGTPARSNGRPSLEASRLWQSEMISFAPVSGDRATCMPRAAASHWIGDRV